MHCTGGRSTVRSGKGNVDLSARGRRGGDRAAGLSNPLYNGPARTTEPGVERPFKTSCPLKTHASSVEGLVGAAPVVIPATLLLFVIFLLAPIYPTTSVAADSVTNSPPSNARSESLGWSAAWTLATSPDNDGAYDAANTTTTDADAPSPATTGADTAIALPVVVAFITSGDQLGADDVPDDADGPNVRGAVSWTDCIERMATWDQSHGYGAGTVSIDAIVWADGESQRGCYAKAYEPHPTKRLIWGGNENWITYNKAFNDSDYGPAVDAATQSDCAKKCRDSDACAVAIFDSAGGGGGGGGGGSCQLKSFTLPSPVPGSYFTLPWWKWSANGSTPTPISWPSSSSARSVAAAATTGTSPQQQAQNGAEFYEDLDAVDYPKTRAVIAVVSALSLLFPAVLLPYVLHRLHHASQLFPPRSSSLLTACPPAASPDFHHRENAPTLPPKSDHQNVYRNHHRHHHQQHHSPHREHAVAQSWPVPAQHPPPPPPPQAHWDPQAAAAEAAADADPRRGTLRPLESTVFRYPAAPDRPVPVPVVAAAGWRAEEAGLAEMRWW
ncbi:hypothetical protein DFJ73DRAFT_962893 [Zopfochytrium polystomum]|nr:hypothetical protein DFJ73DRAFT_962893 [Zopfochytrium polystomum]